MEAGARIGQPHSSGRLRPGVIATVVPGAYLYPFATRFVADDLRTLAKVREG